jgi:hypothetical protein
LKRKLDFSAESDLSAFPVFETVTTESDFGTLISNENLDRALAGEDDHGWEDLFDIYMESYQSDGSGMPHSSSTLNGAQNIPATPNDFCFSSTLHGRLYINLTD